MHDGPRGPGRKGAVLVGLFMAIAPSSGVSDDVSIKNGAVIYERCQACHSLARNRTGPKHCGLFGRRAGSLADFFYSGALRDWGEVWTRDSLDRFLEAPLDVVPGTLMGYDGVKSALDRADLVAYLWHANQDPATCPPDNN